MSKLTFSCIVEIPDDLFSGASASLAVKPAWDIFIAALNETGVKFSTTVDHGQHRKGGYGRPAGSKNKPKGLPVEPSSNAKEISAGNASGHGT